MNSAQAIRQLIDDSHWSQPESWGIQVSIFGPHMGKQIKLVKDENGKTMTFPDEATAQAEAAKLRQEWESRRTIFSPSISYCAVAF